MDICRAFCRLRPRADLVPMAPLIETCLTDLALQGEITAATPYQAINVLGLLFTRVLMVPLADRFEG